MRGTVAKRLRKTTIAMIERRKIQMPFKRVFRLVKKQYNQEAAA